MPGSSADVHISLFKRAYEFSTDSPLNFLVGNGFQASQNLLKDYFPDNKYANFHSLYLTLIVESGFFSLIAILIFLAYPIIFKVSLRPILIGVVVFNIFYQSILDPVFWFIYLFGWMSINNKKE